MAKLVKDLKVGNVIMPPPREIRLWMRRALQERNLPETALHLTIVDIYEGAPDKRGPWVIIKTHQTPEWLSNHSNREPASSPFSFKARPETPWVEVSP